ncbi:MAG: hypothetical protein CM1200mP2_43050 [Planctomycetaceae bacterium]|nr:MAG: hypothetical protein CM1200mP2_43050 [Planctomycetaceae bacterium]
MWNLDSRIPSCLTAELSLRSRRSPNNRLRQRPDDHQKSSRPRGSRIQLQPAVPGQQHAGVGVFPRLGRKQALSNFQMGRVNGDLGFWGLVLSAGSESINILLRALSENRRVEVLSRPMIQALHNQFGFDRRRSDVPAGQRTGGPEHVDRSVAATAPGACRWNSTSGYPAVSPDGSITMEVVATKDGITRVGRFRSSLISRRERRLIHRSSTP